MLPSDVDELNKASAYLMAAPVVTSVMVWGYSKMREEGGASSHFAHAIRRAKSRFTKAPTGSKGKWPSKNSSDQSTMADQDTEPTESQKTSTAIADVYKQMKQDK